MKPQAFDRSEHVYRNDAFAELVKDAIRFFNGTPVHTLPPLESFLGTGVYALYYTGGNPLCKRYAELNRLSYDYQFMWARLFQKDGGRLARATLTADGNWVSAKRSFLFPVRALSSVYRGKFLAALDGGRGDLRYEAAKNDTAWRKLLTALRHHDWVVYAKQPLGDPAQVLEYLGRYTHRVAISNERILGMEGSVVRFRMRDSANGNRKKLMRMEAGEFIGRFIQHILPKGFKRIRHYGLIGPAHKAANLAAARAALDAPAPNPVLIESVEAFMRRVAGIEWLNCRHCGVGRFVVIEAIPPSPLPHPPPQGPP